MKLRKLVALSLSVVMAVSFGGCGKKEADNSKNTVKEEKKEETVSEKKEEEKKSEATTEKKEESTATEDPKQYAGTTLHVYTHQANRVQGEEMKDKDGNTYRDPNTAILKILTDKFTQETGINVEFTVVSNEDELRPLFQVEDDGVDVFTAPNWSLTEWQTYAEPYMTLQEGEALYGEYAVAMPNDGEYIYSVMPGKAYSQCVVYNEGCIKSVGYDEIPGSLDEFNTMCDKLKEAGITPISMHRVENWPLACINDFARYVAGDANAFEKMLQSDTPFNEDEPFGKTIKQYTQWKANGYFEQEVYTDFGVAMDSVAYGRAAMMLFGSWVVPQIQGRVPQGSDPSAIKFAPAPDFGAGRYVLGAPADNYAICKYSKQKEAAKLYIEYLSKDAQFIADSGFIANRADVTPVVPELYSIIDNMVEAGQCKVLMTPAQDENAQNNQDVLTEAGLWSDYNYAGLLFDALDVTKPDDWSAYEAQVKAENEAYAEAKEDMGVKWQD